jgi:tRNA (cytidine/uridine-2'-O-)-methyltransferase
MELHIVLHQPEIPPNTGNIVRTCAALGARLHLIKPLGFAIDDATVKRAGLDYWDKANVHVYENTETFFAQGPGRESIWYASTKAWQRYDQVNYDSPTWLMFGKETQGLPEEFFFDIPHRTIKLPMRQGIRSLNLSNSVAICAYEVMRQWDFPGLFAGSTIDGQPRL